MWPPCDHCLLLNEYKWNWAGGYENINYNVILRQDILTIYTTYFFFGLPRTDWLSSRKACAYNKQNILSSQDKHTSLLFGFRCFMQRSDIVCFKTKHLAMYIHYFGDIYQKSAYLHPNNLYFEENLHWNLSIYHTHLEKCNSLLFRNQIRVTLLMPNRFYWFRLM